MLWNGSHSGARSRRSVLVTLDNLEIPSVQFWRGGRDKIHFGYLYVTWGFSGSFEIILDGQRRTLATLGCLGSFGNPDSQKFIHKGHLQFPFTGHRFSRLRILFTKKALEKEMKEDVLFARYLITGKKINFQVCIAA